MVRVRFEQVTLKATRRWRDPATGKLRQQTRTFCQTLNPFNTKDGAPKTRDQIMEELVAERDAWLATRD
jgi:hypothetical protein